MPVDRTDDLVHYSNGGSGSLLIGMISFVAPCAGQTSGVKSQPKRRQELRKLSGKQPSSMLITCVRKKAKLCSCDSTATWRTMVLRFHGLS